MLVHVYTHPLPLLFNLSIQHNQPSQPLLLKIRIIHHENREELRLPFTCVLTQHMMAPWRFIKALSRPPYYRWPVIHLVAARALNYERLHCGAAVGMWGRGGVGGKRYEKGDEGFAGNIGGMLVGEERGGFAGAAGNV